MNDEDLRGGVVVEDLFVFGIFQQILVGRTGSHAAEILLDHRAAGDFGAPRSRTAALRNRLADEACIIAGPFTWPAEHAIESNAGYGPCLSGGNIDDP